MEPLPFAYMAWAKEHYFDAPLSLVPSGMPAPSEGELPLPGDLDLRTEEHGEARLTSLVARIHRVEPEGLLLCQGSTQADFLVFQRFLDPGDEVCIEHPAYGLFASLASLRGARVRPLVRDPLRGFRIGPEELEASLGERTRLVVITTVHNPSGAVTSPEDLRAMGELCAERGVPLLCSEVYVDFLEGTEDPPGRAGHRPYGHECHPWILSANSMTKVYGLGSLRFGWVAGRPEWIRELAKLREIVAPVIPAVPQRIAAQALEGRRGLLERARRTATGGRKILEAFLEDEEGFRASTPGAGLTAFVEVRGVRDTRAFRDFLKERFGIGVVPGEFFGLPGYFRIGYGIEPSALAEGLEKLADGRRAWLRP